MDFNLSMFEYSLFKSSYFKLPRMSYEAFKINFAFWIPTKLQQQHLSEHFHLNKGVIRCIHTSLCMKGLVDILLEINLRKMLKQKRSLQISSMVTHVFYAVQIIKCKMIFCRKGINFSVMTFVQKQKSRDIQRAVFDKVILEQLGSSFIDKALLVFKKAFAFYSL